MLAIPLLGQAENWKLYLNKKRGYAFHYPANGTARTTGKEIRKDFYFDPLAPISDLNADPTFANIRMSPQSIVKIVFPDKYLITLVLDNTPPKTPPPATKPITIGKYIFYRQHTTDAGMCHYYDYYTYFLPHGTRYYTFIFLSTTRCSLEKNAQKSSPASPINPQDFEKILRTVRLI